jgi:hypothetical protein
LKLGFGGGHLSYLRWRHRLHLLYRCRLDRASANFSFFKTFFGSGTRALGRAVYKSG